MTSRVLPWAALFFLMPTLVLAQATSMNNITQVTVKGTSVEIKGSKKASFTTFTMTDPPRLVVDISEAVFVGVPEEIPVGNGTITAIRTASYGSESAAIARVLIGFEREVETNIEVVSVTKLVVKANALTPPTVAAAPKVEEPVAAAPTVAVAATPVPAAPAAPKVAPAPEPKAAPKPNPLAAASLIAMTTPAEPPAEAVDTGKEERAAQHKAAEQALAAQADELAAKAAAAQVKEEAKQAALDKAAELKAAREQQRAEKLAAAELAAKEKAERAEAAKAERAQRLAEKNLAAAEAKAELQRAAEEKAAARRAAVEPPVDAPAALPPPKEVRVASITQAPGPLQNVVHLRGRGLSVSERRRTMTLVGFKSVSGTTGRVFVRTNEPVKFSVTEAGDRTLVLELENTRIHSDNDRRALDTTFFNTAVAQVQAESGTSRNVRIQIKLKENVAYEAHQEGNEVVLDFPAKP